MTAATADKPQAGAVAAAWAIVEDALADYADGNLSGLFVPSTLAALATIEAEAIGGAHSIYARLDKRHADELNRAVWRWRQDRQHASTGQPDGEPLRAIGISEFVGELAPPTYALDGVLIKGYCFAITAPSGHGKTAIALTLAVACALGLPFAGRETDQCRVLYVAGENPDDVRMRVQALLDALDLTLADLEPHLLFVGRSFALAEHHAELMALIEAGDYGMVILDTDQALSSDADENSNRDRIEHAKRVRMLTKARPRPTVIDLCHPPVNAGRTALRPRGGSSFLAEIDGNLGCWIDEGDTRIELFRTPKFRGPMFDPIVFDLKVIEIPSLTDSKGRPMTAAIALPADDAGNREADQAARKRRIALLADISLHPTASVRERLDRLSASRATLYRDAQYLLAKSAIAESLDGFEITPKGKKWLAAT